MNKPDQLARLLAEDPQRLASLVIGALDANAVAAAILRAAREHSPGAQPIAAVREFLAHEVAVGTLGREPISSPELRRAAEHLTWSIDPDTVDGILNGAETLIADTGCDRSEAIAAIVEAAAIEAGAS